MTNFAIFLAVFLTAVAFSSHEIDPYAATGPNEIVVDASAGPGNAFTLFYPKEMSENSAALTWGNGTGMAVARYEDLLRHLASHGFVVIASHSRNTGTGKEMIQGIDWLLKESNNPSSVFYKKISPLALGALGHSQGGGGAIRAGTDKRISATAPLHPLQGPVQDLKGPALFFTSTNDVIVPPGKVIRMFKETTMPAILANLIGEGHTIIANDGGPARGYLTAWFKWELLSDIDAGWAFMGPSPWLESDTRWKVMRNY